MSNTTCRPRGIAKRALALLTAIALATTLTPNFAFAGEANNSASITAEQSSTAGSTGSLSADDATANKADATPDASESQASGSDSAAGHAAASNSKADAGELTDPSNANKIPSQSANSAKPANQASSTKADTVSATLKISVYGTTLVSHTFTIEKGKTVEDMLNLAVKQGYISSYSHGKPLLGHTAYYVNSITVNGITYTQPTNYSEYWSSTINGAWESDGINGNKIESDGFSYELSYVSNDPNTKFEDYPTSPNAPHPDKATGSDTTSYVKNEGNTSAATSAPTSFNNAALSWKKAYGNGNYSEILTLGDSIYFASSLLNANWTPKTAVLHRLNSKGEETASLQLFGTTLVSHTFTIEKGKTVEDMLNLAVKQGYISSYSHGKPLLGHTAYYVNSITVNGITYTQPTNYSEYWSSTINGAWESDGINGNKIESDGFSYELSYVSNDPNTKFEDYPTSPNAPHPDKATGSDTTSYVKNEGNTSAATSAPTSFNNAALSWKKAYGNGNYSEILTLGDSIYFASSLLNANWTPKTAVLHRLNSKGEETASLQLFGTIDASTCRMAYTDGVIVIPLSNGRLQGVSASEMKTLWVSGAIASGAQSISTVTASGGMVFTGTANSLDTNYNATTGTFFGINAITGERVWANEEANTGFYWSGACKVGNVLLYGNDAGVLTAVDPATGKTVSALKLSSAIRSTVISNNAETEAYVTTNDGTLHKISVAPNGSLSELGTASFASKSTSTATLFQGNLFVGGCAADYTGTLSVIDAATMQVKHSTSLPFEVKSAPLVAKAADGNTYAYFTCNGAEGTWPNYTSGGGAWVYCLETNTATKLFDATGSMANWCTKSIIMGADGTLYWTNDSGTLFALANAASSGNGGNGSNSDNTQTPEKPGTNNQQNNKAPGSNASEHAPAATPISAGNASAAAQAPLSDAEALAENEASSEEENGSAVTSASSARGTSSNNGNDSKGAPWLPIAGIVAGCVGLVAVGAFLLRRRSL